MLKLEVNVLSSRDFVPRVAVRRVAGDHPVQPRGPRLPQAAPLHLPGRLGKRLRQEHKEGRGGGKD